MVTCTGDCSCHKQDNEPAPHVLQYKVMPRSYPWQLFSLQIILNEVFMIAKEIKFEIGIMQKQTC